jgi:hypothetical protein
VFDRRFEALAVGGGHLDGIVGDAGGHFAGKEFGDVSDHAESLIEDDHTSCVRKQGSLNPIGYARKAAVSAMSDDEEIREVMRAEQKHKTVKQQEADLRQFMLKAIRHCDEESFLWAVTALGHEPGSDEYEKFRKRWRALVGKREI